MVNDQENLLRRYLLGNLPESEQETIETQYFSDAGWLEEVWAVENRLVDDYVRDRLARAERGQFEQYYLDSPLHRERVALARMLLRAADAASDPVAPELSSRAQFRALWRMPQLAWGLSFATLLLLAGGAWLMVERTRERAQFVAVQSEQRERVLAAELAATRAQNERLAAVLAARQTTPSPSPSPTPSPVTQPPVLVFALTASLLRGNAAPQLLTIPRQARQVKLQMRLEARDYAFYQIQVRTVEGATVWRSQTVKPHAGRVAIAVPAAKLSAGDYILTLSGVSTAPAVAEVNRYFFRVGSK